jgi:hypothetical protein
MLPNIETRTGDVLRLSDSGNVIETVRTDPKLVPSHKVGMRAVGSGENLRIQHLFELPAN